MDFTKKTEDLTANDGATRMKIYGVKNGTGVFLLRGDLKKTNIHGGYSATSFSSLIAVPEAIDPQKVRFDTRNSRVAYHEGQEFDMWKEISALAWLESSRGKGWIRVPNPKAVWPINFEETPILTIPPPRKNKSPGM